MPIAYSVLTPALMGADASAGVIRP
jgi:hypothetical protein